MNASRTETKNLTEADVIRSITAGPSRLLDIGGGKVAHYRFGRGPDVLFVHGWPLHAATFRALVPELATEFTCHLVDLPGAGRSTPGPGAPIHLLAHATTLRAVADALELDDYAVVAHDSGALVARYLAAADGRIRGLVLEGTEIPGHVPWLIAMYMMMARTPFGASIARAALSIPVLRRSALGYGGCFTDPRFVDGAFGELLVQPLLASRRATEDAFQLLRGLDGGVLAGLRDVHRRIGVPVDLIWGTEDPFFPIEKARRMAGEFGGPTRFHAIEGAKLFAHEDHPEAFAPIAKRALRSYFEVEQRAGAALAS